MPKSKYERNVLPNIDKIMKMANDGVTVKDIAKALGVGHSTFSSYLSLGKNGDERYKSLAETFAQACRVADDAVEAALYKRACGFEYIETKTEQKLDKFGNVVELTTKTNKVVPPDVTSAMFWLTNRQSEKWQYKKPKEDASGADDAGGVVVLAPVMEADDERKSVANGNGR